MKKLLLLTVFILYLLSQNDTLAASSNLKIENKDYLLQGSAGINLVEYIVITNSSETVQRIETKWSGYKLSKSQVVSDEFLINHSIDFANLPQTTIDLGPFDTGSLTIEFNIPSTLKSGDYYGSLELNSATGKEVVDFTIRILGELTEQVQINESKATKDTLIFKVANTGNISSDFSISSALDKFIGADIKQRIDKQTLKAGETREVSIKFGNLLPGYYQTENKLTYGNKDTEKTSLYSFWVRQEFFIVSVLTLFLSLIVIWFIKSSSKRNA